MSKTVFSHSLSYRSLRHLPAFALAGVLLTGISARAQTPVILSLTPAASAVAVGSTVTFTVNVTGGTNLGGYGFNILIDPTKLAFVANTPPYTSLDADFSSQFTDSIASSSDLMVVFTQDPRTTTGINNVGPTALGTFQLKVLSALPLLGSNITFGPIGNTVTGGSEVDDRTGANVLTGTTGAVLTTLAAPEPSQEAALGLGVLGLGALALTARRRFAAGHKA